MKTERELLSAIDCKGWPAKRRQALARIEARDRAAAEAGAANCEGPYVPADGQTGIVGFVGCLAVAVLSIAIVACLVEVFCK